MSSKSKPGRKKKEKRPGGLSPRPTEETTTSTKTFATCECEAKQDRRVRVLDQDFVGKDKWKHLSSGRTKVHKFLLPVRVLCKTKSNMLPPSWRCLVLLLLAAAAVVSAVDDFDDEDDEARVEQEFDESIISVETIRPEDDVVYITPETNPDVFFAEHFDDEDVFERKWIKSQAKKDGTDDEIAKYDGVWSLEPAVKDPLNGDTGN